MPTILLPQATKVYTRADIVYEHDFESCTEEVSPHAHETLSGSLRVRVKVFDCDTLKIPKACVS